MRKERIHRTLSPGLYLTLPYCRLAIVPNLEPDVCDCCAFVIEIMLDDIMVTTTAATTIMIGGLVINVCLLLGVTITRVVYTCVDINLFTLEINLFYIGMLSGVNYDK